MEGLTEKEKKKVIKNMIISIGLLLILIIIGIQIFIKGVIA